MRTKMRKIMAGFICFIIVVNVTLALFLAFHFAPWVNLAVDVVALVIFTLFVADLVGKGQSQPRAGEAKATAQPKNTTRIQFTAESGSRGSVKRKKKPDQPYMNH